MLAHQGAFQGTDSVVAKGLVGSLNLVSDFINILVEN
jgi:hypothetical protein